ncbi:MAG: ABC transporter substrate-binding protein [Thermoanaerobaculia bacterium]
MTPADARRLADVPPVRLVPYPFRQYDYIAWNTGRPPFDDARIRRAMTLAINRQALVGTLLAGYGRVAVSTGPVALLGLRPLARTVAVRPRPGARAILARKGFADRDGDGIVGATASRSPSSSPQLLKSHPRRRPGHDPGRPARGRRRGDAAHDGDPRAHRTQHRPRLRRHDLGLGGRHDPRPQAVLPFVRSRRRLQLRRLPESGGRPPARRHPPRGAYPRRRAPISNASSS